MLSQAAQRLPGQTNELYRLRDRLRAAGRHVHDLVSGNVNELGIVFPQDLIEEILTDASRKARVYRPDSLGQHAAREAVARYYAACGERVPESRVVLTPGTSIAYWYCFKLLADEGDEILCPRPSYPLFDYIAALSGVRLVPYRLLETRDWGIDLDYLEASISTRTRAIVLISPHNPTGAVCSHDEIQAVGEIAARHGLAIISDEVFCEFRPSGGDFPRPFRSPAPLNIVLNGFSKMFALPGMKLGWMALSGKEERVTEAMRALELICDTFLPVNETVQASVPAVFDRGSDFLRDYVLEVARRRDAAESVLTNSGCISHVPPAGGFYVSLRLDQGEEEAVARAILEEEGILVHPGYFYDMDPHHLVLAFVQPADEIRGCLERALRVAGRAVDRGL